MSADWDYAQLAKAASENGGPERFLEAVKDASRSDGRAQGVVLGLLIGVPLAAGGYKALDSWRRKRELAAIAEHELLLATQPSTDAEPD